MRQLVPKSVNLKTLNPCKQRTEQGYLFTIFYLPCFKARKESIFIMVKSWASKTPFCALRRTFQLFAARNIVHTSFYAQRCTFCGPKSWDRTLVVQHPMFNLYEIGPRSCLLAFDCLEVRNFRLTFILTSLRLYKSETWLEHYIAWFQKLNYQYQPKHLN